MVPYIEPGLQPPVPAVPYLETGGSNGSLFRNWIATPFRMVPYLETVCNHN